MRIHGEDPGASGRSLWRVLCVGLMLWAALALAACGSDSTASDDAGGDATATDLEPFKWMTPAEGSETVDTSQFKSDSDRFTIGFADVSLENSWRVQARKTAEINAEKWGVDLRVTDAGGDAKKQISDIEDLLTQGVDALVVSPVAPKPLAPVIERAAASGIPVTVWSGKVDTDQYTSEVVTDNYFFGKVGGEFLCDALDGDGDVIALRGIAGITVETDVYNGASEAMDKCGLNIIGEEYGDWAFAKGKKITENLLAANGSIDGVWSSGGDMTRGAIEAFQEAGKKLVPMTGETLNGFLKLWKKEGLESVGPADPPWEGAEALKLAILALQGKEISKDYLIRIDPITNETLDESILPDVSDDFWIDQGYLTQAEIKEIFPGK